VRVLAVADHVDPLVYSPAIKERFPDIDLVLGAGDLPMDYYDYIVSCLNRPLVFVFGNHNLRYLEFFRGKIDALTAGGAHLHGGTRRMPGGIYVDRKVRKIRGLLIAGLGGSPWYNGGPNQFREAEMRRRILLLVPRLLWNRLLHGRYLDVLLTHSPPFGVGDGPDRAHQGFRCILWFIRRFRPRYLIHGHVHLYDRNQERLLRYEETAVVNAYDHVVIDVDGATDG
jgi:hypothetical protein